MPVKNLEHIFREYDIRGLLDTEINEEFVRALGFVLAAFYKEEGHKRILIGYDTRKNSALFHDILAKVFSLHGLHVISLGMVPTPCLYFSIHHLGIFAGIEITASHNPAEFSGFKLWNGETTLSGEKIRGLYHEMQKFFSSLNKSSQTVPELMETMQKQNSAKGFISFYNCLPSYAEKVLENSEPLDCSLVIDGANGAAGKLCADIFRKARADVHELFCEEEENFPNHNPDPTRAKNLQALLKTMREKQAKYGIALDGDGDRVVLADKNCRILKSDELISIFINEIIKKKPDALFLVDVKCSQELINEIKRLGAKYQLMPTGHSTLKKGMLKTGADFGGELSGHFFHAENWYKTDDGILTAVRLISLLEKNNLDLTALPNWGHIFTSEEIAVPCTKERKKTINQRVIAHFTQKYQNRAECICIDGIRCVFENSWFLVRASQTGEQLTVRFEAKTEEEFVSLKSAVLSDLEKILQA
jgi:Phosphomannomutase